MRAFIIRPFGRKTARSGLEIDFEAIEAELIAPALQATGFQGLTTGDIVAQGNIREDMFQRLLTAELVIADITIHNANAFYELGIRHALRDRVTFLLRGRSGTETPTDEVPFDLKTDRYLAYDVAKPEAALEALISAISASLRIQREKPDSPVFQLLPKLQPAEPEVFLVAPRDFRETVKLRQQEKRTADLALMSLELDRFDPDWGRLGQRLVAEALFRCKAFAQAVEAWKRVRRFDELDVEANHRLGTCYSKLGLLDASDQALDRMDDRDRLTLAQNAERLALFASNEKTRWINDWSQFGGDDCDALVARREAALESPWLQKAADRYEKAFEQDLNHFYSGLNAFALRRIQLGLAEALPELWDEIEDEASSGIGTQADIKRRSASLAAAVEWSVKANSARAGQGDRWAEITEADFAVLVGKNAGKRAAVPMGMASSSPTATG